jgi:hypothetical protein
MAEHERETRVVKVPTLIQGTWYEKGDEVEIYPFQRRHLVEGGYVEGDVPEEVASDGEKDAGALNALKRSDERDDMDVFDIQKLHERGYGFGEAQTKEEYEESADGSVYRDYSDQEDK